MNIHILSDRYPPDVGGLAVSTRRLAQGLAALGHAVHASAPSAAVAPGEWVTSGDGPVMVHRLGACRRTDDTLAGWFDRLVACQEAAPADLFHALYVAHPAFVAVAAARYLGLPSVISARGNDLDRSAFDPGRFAQVTWSLQNAGAVTAVSRDLARKARALAPGLEVHWVPNGVDTALFTPGPRDEGLAAALSLGSSPAIAFVGEARQKKGLTILLPAFAHLAESINPRPILLLVGGLRRDDAPVLEVFRRQNPGLDVRVVPNLPHGELPAYYRLADLLVIPSLRDGLPNALLEGMACGRAVVASRVGGIPDVLHDGEDGLLVSPGDPLALATAMGALLADPARRARLGDAARARVASDFTPALEVERNLQVYRQLLPNR